MTGIPLAIPIGFARLADELVIHGSTGSPWLRALEDGGAAAAVSVTTLDGVVVARSGFESSFRYRSAVLFGTFEAVPPEAEKADYLNALTDTFIPRTGGRTATEYPQRAGRERGAADADRCRQLVAQG